MDLISKQRDFLCNRAQKTAKMNSAWLHWRLFFWSASPQNNQFALEIHYTLPPFFIEIFFPMPKEDYFRFHERFFATGADSWEFSSFFYIPLSICPKSKLFRLFFHRNPLIICCICSSFYRIYFCFHFCLQITFFFATLLYKFCFCLTFMGKTN